MRALSKIALAIIALLTAGCGNWSNRDLEFAQALPTKEDLKSKLPVSSVSSPLEGTQTREDGLNLGDPSAAYAYTKNAQSQFNNLLDLLLGVIDTVRSLQPSKRTEDSRTWGPYPDSKNPGWEFSVTIKQTAEREFQWSISATNTKGDTTLQLLQGVFVPTDSARKGSGIITVPVKDFRGSLSVDQYFKSIDRFTIAYDVKGYPRDVALSYEFTPGSSSDLSSAGFLYREQQDKSGYLAFRFTSTTNPYYSELDMVSRWLPSGEGVAAAKVTKGPAQYVGFTAAECWNSTFKVIFYYESWQPGQAQGQLSDCPDVRGF